MKLNGSTGNKPGKGSTRRKLAGALALLLALGLLAGLTIPALAVGELPHQFWGYVTTDGVTPVPEGTVVMAEVRGVQRSTTVDTEGRYGWAPTLLMPADNLNTPGIIEGGRNGDTVDFYVNDVYVDSYEPFQLNGFTRFDLEAPMDIPPTVVSTLPEDLEIDVAPGAVVSATFSEDIQEGANFGDIDISGGATGVSASITGDTLTIAHNDFAPDTVYTVTIPAGAVNDMTGNPLASDYTWSFTTGIIKVPLEVVSTLPANGAIGVAPGAVVSATFSEDIQEGPNFGDIDISSGATGVSAGITGDTLTIAHDDFAVDTTYTVTIPAGAVETLAADPLEADYTWSFYTGIHETTIDLIAGVNIIPYNGATTDLPDALTNIGPDGLDVVGGLWARGAWTGGEWLFYNARIGAGNLEELETGRAYIICVTGECTWELP